MMAYGFIDRLDEAANEALHKLRTLVGGNKVVLTPTELAAVQTLITAATEYHARVDAARVAQRAKDDEEGQDG